MLLQGAGRPKRHALAVAAGVVPALLVHRLDVLLQGAIRPEGDAGAVGAHVVVHRLDRSGVDSGSPFYRTS